MTATQEKPKFNWISDHAFAWFTECWFHATEIFQAMNGNRRKSPSLGEHFCKYYGIEDKELTDETNLDKQIEIIKRKYVSNKAN